MKTKQLPDWQEVELEKVVWFQEGPGVRTHQFAKEGVKLINVRNIVEGNLSLGNTTNYISEKEAFGVYKHFLVDEEDIIMASSGVTWGKTAVAKKDNLPLCMNTSTIRFKVKDEKVLSKSFLLIFLNSKIFKRQIEILITGGCQPNFGPSHLKQVKIPLPPLPIQKSIVSILEKAEKLKQKQEDADNLTKEYLQSIFYEMFGDPVRNEKNWPKKKLGEISKEIQPGFAYGQFSNTEGLIHLRPFNISNDGFLILDQLKYIPSEIVTSEKYLLSKGDVLINTTNSKELVGKTAIFNLDNRYCFSNHMTKIRLNNSVADPNYIWFVLNKYWILGFFKSIIKSWVNQVGIDSNLLKNQIEIPLPPLPLQQTFASIVEHVEKLKEKQKRSKEEINNLFNSLMQKAFKGWLGR